MAELGLVATLITVAGAGGKVALGFYEISDRLGLAGKEARRLASEVKTLTSVLSLLSIFILLEGCVNISNYERLMPRHRTYWEMLNT